MLDGPSTAGGAIPPLVASYYLRSVLDWATSVLVKGLDKQHQQSKGTTGGSATSVRLQPDAWALLSSVLAAPATPPTQPLPAALLPAITATLQALAGPQHKAAAAAVLRQVAGLLELTTGKFADSFHPGLEHAVAAAEAALAGHAAAGERRQQEAWQPVALHAVRLLHAAAVAHPSPRKVFEAAVTRLLLPLARMAFSGGDGSSERSAELPRESRALLTAALFSPTHVAPLAEAMAASAAAPDASGEARRSYAAQLLPALARLLDDGALPLLMLPWMVGSFAAALEQHRHAERMQGSIAADAASGRSVQADGDGVGGGLPSQQVAEGSSGGGGQRGGAAAGQAGLSADFQFWAALVRLLLRRLDWQSQKGSGSTELLRGLAALAACLKERRLYRPTQDADGTQHALLQRLTDAALDTAATAQRAGGVTAAPVVRAALQVVQGVLAVEHRPAQAHLTELFPLLWADEGDAVDSTGSSVQVSLACGLVAAYGELRQLEVVLQALAAALLAAPATAAPAAGALLDSPAFASQLATTASRLPSGQVPSAIRFATATATQLVNSSGSPHSALLLADLLACCLGSLRVELSMALGAAEAATALVVALAPGLLPLLLQPPGELGGAASERLAALLSLYRLALGIHACCAALHPEASPLGSSDPARACMLLRPSRLTRTSVLLVGGAPAGSTRQAVCC